MTYLDPEQTAEVEVLSGSCMMVRKSAMDQVGLLDEDYFMYGEDIDWCYRFHQAGWKIYYVPTTEIIHFRGESGRGTPLKNSLSQEPSHVDFRQQAHGAALPLLPTVAFAGGHCPVRNVPPPRSGGSRLGHAADRRWLSALWA